MIQPMMTSPLFESVTSSSRYQTNGFSHNNTYFPEDEDESMYRLIYRLRAKYMILTITCVTQNEV